MTINPTKTCIAVDDEPFALKIIEDFCAKIPHLKLLHAFNNAVEASAYLKSHQPDIVFLDIRMPDISGITLAESLSHAPLIIFTTAHAEYAVKSYNLDAVDYLLKPYDFERFFKAVQKAEQQLLLRKQLQQSSKVSNKLKVKIGYKTVGIDVDSILYLEAMDNYVKIITHEETYIPQMNLKKVLELLEPYLFLRIHKSYAVAKAKIDYYTRKEVSIGNNTLPVGRSYASDFLETMNKKGNK